MEVPAAAGRTMSASVFVFYYLVMCLLVACCAIGRRPGFLLTFLASILITPFVCLLLLYITRNLCRPAVRDARYPLR